MLFLKHIPFQQRRAHDSFKQKKKQFYPFHFHFTLKDKSRKQEGQLPFLPLCCASICNCKRRNILLDIIIRTVLISKINHLIKRWPFHKENFTIFKVVYILSWKGYVICELDIDKTMNRQMYEHFKLVVLFAYVTQDIIFQDTRKALLKEISNEIYTGPDQPISKQKMERR